MGFIRQLPLVLAAAVTGVTLLAAACGPVPPPPPPNSGPTAEPVATAEPTATATATSTSPAPDKPAPTASATSSATDDPALACKLPAPVKSGDKCKTDADCGVSDPCHAHACVAKTKSHPPDKSTVCTRLMDCHSADANTCACFEGVCALVPPK